MRALCLAGLALAASVAMAAAQEMKPPRISHAQVDWNAVTAELQTTDAFGPVFDDGDGVPIPPVADPLGVLNRAVSARFPDVAASAVPVLLPFDVERLPA